MTSEFASTVPGSGESLEAIVDGLDIHLQPIIDTANGAVWAFEALARFASAPLRPVDEAIAAAHLAGYGHALEAACLQAALARRAELPAGVRLALNVSPDVLANPAIVDSWDADLGGVIVEVTEHRASDPAALREQFIRLRERGAAIAVDDVGTGYAGLLRLATMRPDYVKLDRTIVSAARESDAQCAVLEALVAFSHRLGAEVVGEGVETLDDLVTLVEFDVDFGQGWAIGLPAAGVAQISAVVIATCHRARAQVLQRRATDAAVAAASTQGMHAVTGALGRATELAGLHLVTAQAAAELRVDVITASVLGEDGVLREITSGGAAIDTRTYRVADYPATRAVLETGVAVEVHANDPDTDPAERTLLRNMGQESLLIVPLAVGDERIGVLELLQRRHRRWTSTDIAHARGLATHLGNALARITS
jgi:EAL domain-containing protein (putative c-di-GMP-specific phosphodiesterase class I)